MRALRIPCFVLLILLALALANGASMTRRCTRWLDTADAAQQYARAEQWSEADAKLAELQQELSDSAMWLHVTTSHGTADEAERLIDRARLMCELADGVQVEESLAELRVLLRQAAEKEQLTLGNIM
ncbi:MAG: DUF4363 family protein [Oscillospiraceae bacterium]|nr:DUF4363 family protein [Oscillospiraceae bacterium]